MRTRIPLFCLAAITAGSMGLVGCSTAPETPQARQELTSDSNTAVTALTTKDPSLANLLKNSDSYAIFPTVGKAAAGIGASYGHGEVYQGGKRVGYAEMTAATIGASLGGQSYAELIVFRTPEALQRFESGQFTFDASASAVAVSAGAGDQVKWENDTAVYLDLNGGLMADASIGGQKFNFTAQPANNP
jgi:lipid-binding SYLF domain-containing protein